MARRLATTGYYVMLPNLYYRSGVMELGPLPQGPDDPARQRIMALMESLSIPLVMADADALIAFAADDAAASAGPAGCVGYCMSGRYAINLAVRHPRRIAAAASIYGTHLVTGQPDSPHLAPGRTPAALYFACAETDRWAPPETVDALRRAVEGFDAEVELYPGVEHGFAFPQRAAYDKAAAERHWEKLSEIFRRKLG